MLKKNLISLLLSAVLISTGILPAYAGPTYSESDPAVEEAASDPVRTEAVRNGMVSYSDQSGRIRADKKLITLELAAKDKLSFSGINAAPGEISFFSSKPSVVQIDSDGVIYAIGTGTATVTAWYNGKSAKTKIKVSKAGEDGAQNFIETYTGNGLKARKFEIYGAKSEDLTFSSNEMIISEPTTAGGVIKNPADVIYVSSKFGTVSYVSYKENPRALDSDITVGVGETKTLKTSGIAEGIIWKSKKRRFVQVDSLGRVTGIKAKKNGKAVVANIVGLAGKKKLNYTVTVDPNKKADSDSDTVANEVRLAKNMIVSLSPGGRIIYADNNIKRTDDQAEYPSESPSDDLPDDQSKYPSDLPSDNDLHDEQPSDYNSLSDDIVLKDPPIYKATRSENNNSPEIVSENDTLPETPSENDTLPETPSENLPVRQQPLSNKDIVAQMGLGFNLGCTFTNASLTASRLKTDDIRNRIDAAYNAGFSTIRCQTILYPDMNEDGHLSDKTGRLAVLKETVDYAQSKGMYVIVGNADLGEGDRFKQISGHEAKWDLSDVLSAEFKSEFRNMWTDLAELFRDNDYHVIFEAYNEPFQADSSYLNNNKYGYKVPQGPDSWYFAGRCNNLKYIMSVNRTFAEIMADVAPDRCYMISSYNADPRSAYSNYWDKTWEDSADHYLLEDSYWGGKNYGNLYWQPQGLNMDKAIYFCHLYEYGNNFINSIKTLETAFKNRGIDLPVYVDENGTHTANFSGSYVNPVYVSPVSYMSEIGSGLCLWDDTMSMSYLKYGEWTWYNEPLINAMIEAAGTVHTALRTCNSVRYFTKC